ncbi:PEGA domain-containing protein [Myxococcota bacterium]|nr:PEGA domain-containing protein [Myxococcota bacterium]
MPDVKRAVPSRSRPGPVRAVLLLLLASPLAGCLRHVTITSDPVGASVTRRGEEIGTTPLQLTVWPVPFLGQPVRVGLAGYRGQEIPIGRHLGLLRRHTTHHVLLIPGHGGAGTWTPEDAEDR